MSATPRSLLCKPTVTLFMQEEAAFTTATCVAFKEEGESDYLKYPIYFHPVKEFEKEILADFTSLLEVVFTAASCISLGEEGVVRGGGAMHRLKVFVTAGWILVVNTPQLDKQTKYLRWLG
ncbi:hypothetical protein EGR_02039 [Echinococcus granulosus]|uniref:Uncharacterized protein n=1 Tax=Echinococcus granulosus TaxID=6210 RepID=W6UN22_ECHGR|nr:hypothetical protein EGR_02039 [Echinococcus granulosus]EUB62945.1 hypothetical protein EGR_02039 [Echinococcus granulosus]